MVLGHQLLGTLFEQTFEAYPAPTLIVDADVRVLLANRSARALLGERPGIQPILHRRGGEALHCIQAEGPDGCGRQPACEDCVVRRSVRLACEHRRVERCRADLEVRLGEEARVLHLLVSASPVEHEGETLAVLTLEDVSNVVELAEEATQAEREARELGAHLATVVDNLDEGVIVATTEGEIVHWNPSALRLHGFRSVEECRRHLATFAGTFEGFDAEGRRLRLDEWALSRVLRGESIREMEIRVRRPDQGWERVWRVNGSMARGPLGDPLLAVVTIRDVTDERALQAELALSGRLASVGTLVAGVAHEVNNPLAGILANVALAGDTAREVAEALQARGEQGLVRKLDAIAEQLSDARGAADRIAHVVRDLSLIGKPSSRRIRTRLADVIQGAVRWARASMPGSIALSIRRSGDPVVLASGGQLEQVFLNLVTNAANAIPAERAGHVTVTVATSAPGTARVEVIDDGIGMTPETLARIFDPFFTTRDVGAGMGLGLPVCRSIVAAHGGTIRVSSEPGKGTTFVVELPEATRPRPRSSSPG